jgi:hypothetical protein
MRLKVDEIVDWLPGSFPVVLVLAYDKQLKDRLAGSVEISDLGRLMRRLYA